MHRLKKHHRDNKLSYKWVTTIAKVWGRRPNRMLKYSARETREKLKKEMYNRRCQIKREEEK